MWKDVILLGQQVQATVNFEVVNTWSWREGLCQQEIRQAVGSLSGGGRWIKARINV